MYYKLLRKLDETFKNPFLLKRKNTLGLLLNELFYYKHRELVESSNDRLRELKNKHQGERCFIVATGPSLNKTNLSLLKSEIIFGVNSLYKNPLLRTPMYWAVIDKKVFHKHKENILCIDDTTLFLGGSAGRYYLKNKPSKKPLIVKTSKDITVWGERIPDLTKGAYGGGNVVHFCIQIAFYLGFKEVYLVGCDTDFSGMHFDKAKTKESTLSPEKVLLSFELLKQLYENYGRKIYNATVGGKLEIFERVSLEQIL